MRRLYRTRSRYQELEVFSSDFFGRLLVIDGDLMLTERDEFIYHEMIAHVPGAYLPDAKQVLVVGGGDGGTAKQFLQRGVQNVTVVELDEDLRPMVGTSWHSK